MLNSFKYNDSDLLYQIAQGSKQAFNLLYERYWETIYTEAYKRLKDADGAKDLVQEIFTHLWVKRETLQIDNLGAYLHVAIRNKVLKLVNKQKQTSPFFSLLENLPSPYQQADTNLLWKEFFNSYVELLNTLPPKRQLIFKLRFNENRNTKEIARQLGMSRKTVQNQLGIAIEQIRSSVLNLLTMLAVISTAFS